MIALIEQEPTTALSLAAMCRVLEVNRAACCRSREQTTSRGEVELRDAIQRIALEMPGYGSRRITAELRRRGWIINRKRRQRLMREDNLLCLRRVRRVRTTDSRHGLTVYPNLVPELKLSGLNQLWVADITSIRLRREFVYLAVLLDAYSRRCIGWSLGRTLEAELTLAGLRSRRARLRFTSREIVYNDGRSPAQLFSANGETLLSRLSHFRGPLRLTVLTFPIGLILFFSPEAKLHCRQKAPRQAG